MTALTRRSLLAGAAAIPLAPAASAPATAAAAATAPAWTREAYQDAMRKSGRPVELSQAQFDAIQARKPAAIKRIESYLKDRLGSADPSVLAAFEAVPREYYHYDYPSHRSEGGVAYETDPKPWALGYGSALSDYLGQAYMTQVCKPQPGDTTLEIGTGSGFQSSLLSRMVKQSYSIEIIEPLGQAVSKIFAPLGYDNVHTRVGDGYFGWPEVKEGFDIIIMTCAAQYTPPDLFKQLSGAALRAIDRQERRVFEQRVAAAVRHQIDGEHHRQLVIRHGHGAACRAVNDRNRAAPISLPRDSPIAQAPSRTFFAKTLGIKIRGDGIDGRLEFQTVVGA